MSPCLSREEVGSLSQNDGVKYDLGILHHQSQTVLIYPGQYSQNVSVNELLCLVEGPRSDDRGNIASVTHEEVPCRHLHQQVQFPDPPCAAPAKICLQRGSSAVVGYAQVQATTSRTSAGPDGCCHRICQTARDSFASPRKLFGPPLTAGKPPLQVEAPSAVQCGVYVPPVYWSSSKSQSYIFA
ncbi:hypothetical protein J6590_050442 [Homalodisca vitripennis]|nr:hypothetical protein J6590_050442 [Homalodisca vitripennis]